MFIHVFSGFFSDLEPRNNHGRTMADCDCGIDVAGAVDEKSQLSIPDPLLIYWLSMVQWYHILSHIYIIIYIYIYIYPCSYIFTMWHHHVVSIVESTCHPLPLCHPFCPPGRTAMPKERRRPGALERWQGWHPWPLKHAHWDGTFWKLGFSSFAYWCYFRREFSGMIHWLTINVIIPATSSNHPATLRKTHQSVGVTEIMDGPKELRGRNFETDPVYGNVIWLVVSNIWIIFPFHIWDVILPIDELHHFRNG